MGSKLYVGGLPYAATESQLTTLFADGMMEANVTHGVVRITLAQAGTDGKPMASGKLVMPLVPWHGLRGLQSTRRDMFLSQTRHLTTSRCLI